MFVNDSAALVIIDNFKGQITPAITDLLESYNILTCLLPPNTTDRLQPLDLTVNKPVKDFLRHKFDEWHSKEVFKQLEGMSEEEIESFNLRPIDLSMTRMKEVSADWLVQLSAYLAENPSFLVNGWIKSGITDSICGTKSLENQSEDEELPSEDEVSESSEDEDEELESSEDEDEEPAVHLDDDCPTPEPDETAE